MTRDEMKNKIKDIIQDIEFYMLDDSDFYIPENELEKAAERIMRLWETEERSVDE